MTDHADCLGDSQRARAAALLRRSKPGDDADHPAYIFIEPSVGYRMEEGATLKETGAAISL